VFAVAVSIGPNGPVITSKQLRDSGADQDYDKRKVISTFRRNQEYLSCDPTLVAEQAQRAIVELRKILHDTCQSF
jgi:hypothetical protein